MRRVRLFFIFIIFLLGINYCSGKMGGNEGKDIKSSVDSGDKDSVGITEPVIDISVDIESEVFIDQDRDGVPNNRDCDDRNPVVGEGCSSYDIGNGGDKSWNPTPDNSSGVITDNNGNLTLDTRLLRSPYVWVSNAEEGTESKINSETGAEEGRYLTLGGSPSRTAIDFKGNCWVANRAFGGQGSVTKIASTIEDCIDKDGDGEIETSHDEDGDGRININNPNEFLGENDECILFNVEVGRPNQGGNPTQGNPTPGGIPRAMAIAPDPDPTDGYSRWGNGWVGLNGERKAIEIDGESGEILREFDLPLNPYGAIASKPLHKIWFVNAGWQRNVDDNSPGIAYVDYITGEVSDRIEIPMIVSSCGSNFHMDSYGISVDREGRIWVGGRMCGGAFRYTPDADNPMQGRWDFFPTPVPPELPDSCAYLVTRGLVVSTDGYVYTAHSRCVNEAGNTVAQIGLVTRFRSEDGGDISYFLFSEQGNGTIGVDFDPLGRVWAVNHNTNNVTRIDPITGSIVHFPVGRGPYTYSDFTGHSLLLQFPVGNYRDIIEVCENAKWLGISWGGEFPENTSIEIRVRVGASRVELSNAQWHGPWTETPVDLINEDLVGKFIEIDIILISDDLINVPILTDLRLSYVCDVI